MHYARLNNNSGLGYAELTNIRRQNPGSAKHGLNVNGWNQYRLAVNGSTAGKLGASFDRLDKPRRGGRLHTGDQQQN